MEKILFKTLIGVGKPFKMQLDLVKEMMKYNFFDSEESGKTHLSSVFSLRKKVSKKMEGTLEMVLQKVCPELLNNLSDLIESHNKEVDISDSLEDDIVYTEEEVDGMVNLPETLFSEKGKILISTLSPLEREERQKIKTVTSTLGELSGNMLKEVLSTFGKKKK